MKHPVPSLLLFAAVVVAIAYAAFPSEREMLELLMASGKLDRAYEMTPHAVESAKDDFGMLVTAAEVLEFNGEGDRAVATLEHALALKPNNLSALQQMVNYLIWNRRKREVPPYLERIYALEPSRRELLLEIYHVHFAHGMMDEAGAAMARYILAAPTPDSTDEPKTPTPVPTLENFLAPVLRTLARARLEHGPDVLRDQVMISLFALQEEHGDATPAADPEAFQTHLALAMAHCIQTGRQALAKELAATWDLRLGLDRVTQQRFGFLLLESGYAGQAARYLETLADASPDPQGETTSPEASVGQALPASRAVRDAAIRKQAFEASLVAQEFTLAERLLHALERDGDPQAHLRLLASVHEASGAPEKMTRAYMKLVAAGGADSQDLRRMMEAAQWADDKALLREAVTLTEEALATEAKSVSPAMQHLLGETWLALEEPARAYPWFRQLFLLKRDAAAARAMVEAAAATVVHAHEGQARPQNSRAALLEALEAALAAFPDDTKLLAQAAEQYFAMGDHQAGERALRRRLAVTQRSEDVLTYLETVGYAGDAALTKAAVDAAEAFIAQTNPAPTHVRELRLRMAEILGWVGMEEARARQLARAYEAGVDDLDTLRAAAHGFLGAKQYDKALPLFQRIAAAGGDLQDLFAYLDAAAAAQDQRALRNALRLGEDALARTNPTQRRHRELRRRLADAYGWVGREDKRATLLASVAEDTPEDLEAALDAAEAADNAQLAELALRYHERAYSLAPHSHELAATLAERYLWAGREEQAAVLLERLARTGDTPPGTRLLLGRRAVTAQRWAEAVGYLEPLHRSGALARDDAFAYALALQRSGRDADAQHIFMQLVETNASDPGFLAELGGEALFADMPRLAEDCFSRALRVQADNAAALKGLGLAFAAMGDHVRAIDPMQRYVLLRGDDAEARYLLAGYYEASGQGERAEAEYRAALQLLRAPESASSNGQGGDS